MPVAPTIIAEATAIRSNAFLLQEILKHLMLTPEAEAGGFVVFKDKTMRFIPAQNTVPLPHARGLYEPSDVLPHGMGMGKVFDLIDEGWDWVASVHSHPTFAPYPSGIDLKDLFPNQRVNAIWSFVGRGELRFYDCRGVDLFPKAPATPVLWAHDGRTRR